MEKKIEIRNSTAEFLIFQIDGKENGVQVIYKDETIWATQKAMSELFAVGVQTINKHLKNIFESSKISAEYAKEFAESEFEKYRIVQDKIFQSDFQLM